jgi:hypothetical protein
MERGSSDVCKLENPEDVIVNTFSDRWLLIVIFGGIGSFFMLFWGLFMFTGRKF